MRYYERPSLEDIAPPACRASNFYAHTHPDISADHKQLRKQPQLNYSERKTGASLHTVVKPGAHRHFPNMTITVDPPSLDLLNYSYNSSAANNYSICSIEGS